MVGLIGHHTNTLHIPSHPPFQSHSLLLRRIRWVVHPPWKPHVWRVTYGNTAIGAVPLWPFQLPPHQVHHYVKPPKNNTVGLMGHHWDQDGVPHHCRISHHLITPFQPRLHHLFASRLRLLLTCVTLSRNFPKVVLARNTRR